MYIPIATSRNELEWNQRCSGLPTQMSPAKPLFPTRLTESTEKPSDRSGARWCTDTSDPRHFGTGVEVSIGHFGTTVKIRDTSCLRDTSAPVSH